jgi:hypothetical protein
MSKLINKNIIKAMTIGISAVMAASSMNLSAFAEEATNTTPQEPQVPEQPAKESELSAALRLMGEQAETVEDTTNTAVNTIAEAISEGENLTRPTADTTSKGKTVPGTTSATQALEDEFYDGDAVPAGKTGDPTLPEAGAAVILEAGRIVSEADETPDIVEVVGELTDYTESFGNIDAQASVVESVIGVANNYASAGNAAADNADKLEEKANNLLGIKEETEENATGEAETEAKDIIDIVAENRQVVEDSAITIEGATTIDSAEGAIVAARVAGADADSNVKAIEEEVSKITADFEKCESDYKTADGLYQNKLAELKTAQDELTRLEGVAAEDARIAKEELDRLASEAEELQHAAERAEEKYNSTGYAYIAALEKNIQTSIAKNESVPYSDYRKLAVAMMKFYYVPDELGGTKAEVKGWVDKPEYDPANVQKINKKDVYVYDDQEPDGDTIGDVLKYGVCTYTDKNGEKQSICFNWKTLDENKFGTQAGIVIFEKVDHVSIEGKDVPQIVLKGIKDNGEYFDATTNRVYVQIGEENGVKRYAYFDVSTDPENATTELVEESSATEEELDALLADEKDADAATEPVTEVAIHDDENDDTRSEVYNYDSTTGKVTKTVKADVTTTTYTGAKLSEVEGVIEEDGKITTSFDTLSDAQAGFVAELQEVVDGLAAEDEAENLSNAEAKNNITSLRSIKIGDVVIKAGDKVTDIVENIRQDLINEVKEEVKETVAALEGEETTVIDGVVFKAGDDVDKILAENKDFKASEAYAKIGFVEDKDVCGYQLNVGYGNTFERTHNISKTKNTILSKFSYTVPIIGTEVVVDIPVGQVTEEEAEKAFNKDVEDIVNGYKYLDINIPFIHWFDQQGTDLISSDAQFGGSTEIDPQDPSYLGLEWHTNNGRSYTGSVKVTYRELLKTEVERDWLILHLGDINDLTSTQILQKLGIEGATVFDNDPLDDSLDRYTIYYYVEDQETDVTIEGTDKSVLTADAIKAAVDEKSNAINSSNMNKFNFTYDISTATAQYAYGYKALKYLLMKADTETAKAISETVFDTVKEGSKSYTEKRNDNWYNNNILISSLDNKEEGGTDYTTDKQGQVILEKEDAKITARFRSKVDEAAGIAAEYVSLANKAAQAQTDIATAKSEIETLKSQIENLPTLNAQTLKAFSASLSAAQAKLNQAKNDRDELVKRLAEVEALFTAKVAELTPAETAVTTTTTTTIAATETPAAAAPAVAAPAPAPAPAPAVANPDNPANQVVDNNADDNTQNTETIENEESALAEGIGEKQTENIEGDETALSEGIGTQTAKKNWPWWWILIVAAVTGGTTFGVIKGNQKKKATEETKKTDK